MYGFAIIHDKLMLLVRETRTKAVSCFNLLLFGTIH